MNMFVFHAKDGESYYVKCATEAQAWKLFLIDYNNYIDEETSLIFLKDKYTIIKSKPIDGW